VRLVRVALGMAGDEALKDLGQVDVRVHAVEFRGFDQ
jgi:hypothetical protein